MKISENWLRQYIDTDLSTEKIAEILTDIGLEVEGIDTYETLPGNLDGVVVGEVLTCEKHPNADKLNLTKVDIGNGTPLQIVCGAPNVAAGQRVAVATVGTTIQLLGQDAFVIKEAKIRGELSQGMLCSEAELNIGSDASGILVLDEEQYQIGQPLADFFENYQDKVLEIGLTPNRTDAMSHYGVARDLYASLQSNGFEATVEKITVPKTDAVGAGAFRVTVEEADLCPRYAGVHITNVVVAPSPDWLQNYLKAIGLKPINNVVDITNYILHAFGQPLHAFDGDKIAGQHVRVGRCVAGTSFTTLDNVERTLSGEELMIKDANNTPLCLAGVMGGATSGVSAATTHIFLESAYFNPVTVRKSAKKHGISSDSSFRFERGVDPNFTVKALKLATQLIQELCGGTVEGDFIDDYPEPLGAHYVILRTQKVEQILGVKIHREKLKEILRLLDIEVLNEIPTGFELAVPPYRADVTREIDVIEEILRIYGYNKIDNPAKFSFSYASSARKSLGELENKIAQRLQALGFQEVMNNSLTHQQDAASAVQLFNPLSNDLAYLRTNLWEGLLENAAFNTNRKSPDLKFFEIGKTYGKKADGYTETKKIALVQTGRLVPEEWLTPVSNGDFFYLKGVLENILSSSTKNLHEDYFNNEAFSEALRWSDNGKEVGFIGVVAPENLQKFDLSQPCYYAEVQLDRLVALQPNENFTFQELPKFNKVRRDLALLVDHAVSFFQIKEAVRQYNHPLVQNIRLFDVYTGDKLPTDKKSYAISVEILNIDKTLDESELGKIMEGLIHVLEKETQAVLR